MRTSVEVLFFYELELIAWNNQYTFDFWIFSEKTTLTHNVWPVHCYEATLVELICAEKRTGVRDILYIRK